MKTQNTKTVRLDPSLHKEAKVLVGYYGHKSVESVVNTALRYFLDNHSKEIKEIKAGR